MSVYIDKISDQKIDLLKFYQLEPKFYPVLLESASPQSNLARYDILFLNPQEKLVLNSQNKLQYHSVKGSSFQFKSNNFLDAFDQLFQESAKTSNIDNSHQQLPFEGGWFTYLSYELAHQIEPILGKVSLTVKDIQSKPALPFAYAIRFQNALVYDHIKDELFLISEDESSRIDINSKIKSDIKKLKDVKLNQLEIKLKEDKSEQFTQAVGKIHEYIVQGDVFQVNLSRKWQADIKDKPLFETASNIYASLRKSNPAPFSCIANIEQHVIISSSPERLVSVQDKKIFSRPIAGTRPRGIDEKHDFELQKQLHGNPKEQSEHVMLIDLIRNDLGRVCEPGSIHVDEFMVNESYQTVHHIVSNVVGQLNDGTTPGQIVRALFPGGTITGCPKVRCMEIIAELEQCQREAYTGSIGYINNDGSMDLNILIRTLLLKQCDNKKLHLSFRAGAGIVHDSIANKELDETRTKALGLINAVNFIESSIGKA